MIHRLFALFFRLSGWKWKNNIPQELKSYVLLGAPHTSNWDFYPAMAAMHFLKGNARFVIKNSWLKFPLNLIMIPLGAHGIDREKLKGGAQAKNTDAMANLFKEIPDFVLLIAPEGTRKPVSHWKTGFYYVAQKAQVPLVLGYMDWKNKEYGLGKVIYPTDFEFDMREIMSFYQTIHGKRPENFQIDSRFTPV